MRIINLVLVFVLFVPLVSAIELSPLKAKVNQVNFDHPYTFFITVINEENTAHGIEMLVSSDGTYLEPYVVFEPKLFRLQPRETKNVKVTFNLNEQLPKGEQSLPILPLIDGATRGQAFTLDFTIPGTLNPKVELIDFKTHSTDINAPVYFNLTFKNTGNTFEKISPKFTIYQFETVVDIRSYEQPISLLPSEEKNIFYFYDPAKLTPDTYRLDVNIPLKDSTLKASVPLLLHSSDENADSPHLWQTNFSTGLFTLLFLIGLIAVSYIAIPKLYVTYRRRILIRRIEDLTAKTLRMEATYKEMVNDVVQFVQGANIALKGYGDKYEIR